MRGDVRAGRWEATGDRAARSVQGGGFDCRLEAGHGEERTRNMSPTFVTLEVSKLSGWLNADAPCRESQGGHAVLGKVRAGRREAVGDRGARSVRGRARLHIGDRAQGGAHMEHGADFLDAGRVEAQRLVEGICFPEHVAHGFDAGGVEAQRLVEHRRALPRVERRARVHDAGRGTGQGAKGVGRQHLKERAGEGSNEDGGNHMEGRTMQSGGRIWLCEGR